MQAKKAKAVKIWTMHYNPLAFGNLYRPVSTTVEPLQSIRIGQHTLHLFKNPVNGQYHVAEGETGALVGHGWTDAEAIAQVTTDLATANGGVVAEQLRQARIKSKQAQEICSNEFWKLFN